MSDMRTGAAVPAKRWVGLLAGALLLWPSASFAQRIVEWPVRFSAGAEPTVTGAGALFWNPAALARDGVRFEAAVIDMHTPEEMGLRTLGAVVAFAVDRTVFGVGYRHAGIDDIPFTEGPPVENSTETVSVGEDEVLLGAAHRLGAVISVGATARYVRAAYAGVDEDAVTVGTGIQL